MREKKACNARYRYQTSSLVGNMYLAVSKYIGLGTLSLCTSTSYYKYTPCGSGVGMTLTYLSVVLNAVETERIFKDRAPHDERRIRNKVQNAAISDTLKKPKRGGITKLGAKKS